MNASALPDIRTSSQLGIRNSGAPRDHAPRDPFCPERIIAFSPRSRLVHRCREERFGAGSFDAEEEFADGGVAEVDDAFVADGAAFDGRFSEADFCTSAYFRTPR